MGKKLRYRFKFKYWQVVVAIAITFISIACSNLVKPDPNLTNQSARETNELTIWWEQGYNLEEDEALLTIVIDILLARDAQDSQCVQHS
jgi:multiple sugar transport system substrate-binding protein